MTRMTGLLKSNHQHCPVLHAGCHYRLICNKDLPPRLPNGNKHSWTKLVCRCTCPAIRLIGFSSSFHGNQPTTTTVSSSIYGVLHRSINNDICTILVQGKQRNLVALTKENKSISTCIMTSTCIPNDTTHHITSTEVELPVGPIMGPE